MLPARTSTGARLGLPRTAKTPPIQPTRTSVVSASCSWSVIWAPQAYMLYSKLCTQQSLDPAREKRGQVKPEQAWHRVRGRGLSPVGHQQ